MSFQAPKGVSEYVPPRSALLLRVREAFAAAARRACYGYVEQAVFEDTQLFVRGVGESTDVVSKEMYTFEDRGGRSITLRPEFTAGLLRCVLERGLHNGPLPVKVWASGPAFRYERPQAGRFRQFYQFDLEALGSEDPAIDAETIAIARDGYTALGLTQVRLLLNSLGDKECRPVYRAALQEFLRGLELDEQTRARVQLNPLRVLDDKRPEVKAQLTDAPVIADHLCKACADHHDVTRLRRAGVVADMVFGERGVKGAMKAADRSGATYAVLIGDAERNAQTVLIKDLKNGEQLNVPGDQAVGWLTERVKRA